MQRPTTATGSHAAEPTPGSFRASTGGDADLFDLDQSLVRCLRRQDGSLN